jgi:hypothetical protein
MALGILKGQLLQLQAFIALPAKGDFEMSQQKILTENRYFIAFGAGGFPQGRYYIGDKEQWKDMEVLEKPVLAYVWSPNPDRPTYDDWQFDGHDADGGFWLDPAA